MNYDCSECPSYCCSYPIIPVTQADVRRIAAAQGISPQEAKERYTEPEGKRGRKLKHRRDARFKASACIFLDPRTRMCTIYRDRPGICEDHPGDDCEWYDRMNMETLMRGRPVVRIRVAPWNIDASHADYDSNRRSQLIRAYARTNGVIPD